MLNDNVLSDNLINEFFADSASETISKSLQKENQSPQQRKRLKQRRDRLERIMDYAEIEEDLYGF